MDVIALARKGFTTAKSLLPQLVKQITFQVQSREYDPQTARNIELVGDTLVLEGFVLSFEKHQWSDRVLPTDRRILAEIPAGTDPLPSADMVVLIEGITYRIVHLDIPPGDTFADVQVRSNG